MITIITSIMPVINAQRVKMRASVPEACWTVRDLASRANGTYTNTINNGRESAGYAERRLAMHKGRKGLVAAGVEFIDENGGGPGVRLRKRQRLKKPK